MTKRVINECDQCGKETPYESIYAIVGREMYGAPSSEDVHEAVDLCPIHMRMLMAEMVAAMDPAAAVKWVARARTKPTPRRV